MNNRTVGSEGEGGPETTPPTTTKAVTTYTPPVKEIIPLTIRDESWQSPASLFLDLTAAICAHGEEDQQWGALLTSLGWQKDLSNWFMDVKGENNTKSRTMFCAHLDTVTSGRKVQQYYDPKNKSIFHTNGTSILGADDRAGVVVILWMVLHQVPGLYMLFSGEERGGIGSREMANHYKEELTENFDRSIAFDRRGTSSVITHQMSSRCCSESFAEALASELNNLMEQPWQKFKSDDTGTFTDTASFMELIPECTNISVGYEGAHGSHEQQDVAYLKSLCDAVVAIDWDALPTVRDPKVKERKTYTYTPYTKGTAYGGYSAWGDDYDDYDWYTKSYQNKDKLATDSPPEWGEVPYPDPELYRGPFEKLARAMNASSPEGVYKFVFGNPAATAALLTCILEQWEPALDIVAKTNDTLDNRRYRKIYDLIKAYDIALEAELNDPDEWPEDLDAALEKEAEKNATSITIVNPEDESDEFGDE